MRVLLCSGVRVLALASYRDQVVPLYSALMTGWSHPNLKRAIYFDHFNYGGDEDFLCSLLVLLVRLRNRGLSDHNLLVYLSDYLAGSLYSVGGSAAASGGEHSTIYDDPRVYQLAISMLLSGDGDDNTAFASQPVVLTPFHISARQNPNYLPWAMHGLLVNSELRRSDQALLRELHAILIRRLRQWRPTERPLRDLAYRLHPVRQLSRL
jgi:hypothetical protein